jgi:hypothetical protein
MRKNIKCGKKRMISLRGKREVTFPAALAMSFI